MQGELGSMAPMKFLNKEYIADGVIFCGMLVNVFFICLILYYFVL